MKAINFERKYYIKDLFRPKQILNVFNYIEFEEVNTFFYCIENDFLKINDNMIFHFSIKEIEEYNILLELMNKTNINDKSRLIIEITNQELFNKVLLNLPEEKKFNIITDFSNSIECISELNKKWYSENPIFKRVKISLGDYREKINAMVSGFTNSHIRSYVIDFDYESFLSMTLDDLAMLEFWIHHLTGWMAARKKGNVITIFEHIFLKKIYISNELKLYLSRKKQKWEFELKLANDLNLNGESITHKELNNLRQYMDLHPKAIYSLLPIRNWSLVDFEQNISIMTHLNEIPLITGLINRWLYDGF